MNSIYFHTFAPVYHRTVIEFFLPLLYNVWSKEKCQYAHILYINNEYI